MSTVVQKKKRPAKKVAKKVVSVPAEAPAEEPEPVVAPREFDKKTPLSVIYPDAPGTDSPYGDKDPVFVRWLYKTYPEDFKKRFYGRRTVMDEDRHKGPSMTKQCVTAQRMGFMDASKRKGYAPEEHEYTGVLEKEYRNGYKNGGGLIDE